MNDDKLLICPYCGGNAEKRSDGYWVSPYFISCKKCRASTRDCKSPEEAETLWNKRAE